MLHSPSSFVEWISWLVIGYYFKEHEPNSLPKLYLLYALTGALTDALGPLPYTEAFQAGEENFTPVFDSQETIYAKLDADSWEA